MKAISLLLSPSRASAPHAHSVMVGRVATYTNTTIRSTTTANVGSTTVVICCRASCMACFRSFLSLDVSFLGLPLSCRIFPGRCWRACPERVWKEGPHSSGQGAKPPGERTMIKNERKEREKKLQSERQLLSCSSEDEGATIGLTR